MSRAWLVAKRYGLDAMIVVAAVSGAVGTLLRDDSERPDGLALWLEAVLVAAVVVALVGRHWYPFAAPASMWLVSSALSFADGRLIVTQAGVFIAGMGGALLLGNLRRGPQTRVGLAIVLACAAVVVYNDPTHSVADLFFTPALFGVCWLVGFALRERADQTQAAEERAARAEREREAAARIAVAEERARIARELHDVVAHAVSVMVLQIGAVRHRMPAGDSADGEALKSAEAAGRSALAEMRRLLNAMRRDDDALELVPHPGLDDLGTLVGDVRAAGLDVRVDVDGEPFALPPALDLSAYRIVQEGLTNTLKHAGATRADVRVHYAPGELRLEVRDNGRGADPDSDGLGHGLVGVRERVKVYGGEMSAAPTIDGGFSLRARLPLEGEER